MPIDNTCIDELEGTPPPQAGGTLQAAQPQGTRCNAEEETSVGGKSTPKVRDGLGEEAPPEIPGYKLGQCLGSGAMGTVYRARQLKLDRDVAIKYVELGANPRPEEVIRFQIEVESLASLQHANVVQVYEVGEYRGRLYLVMELVEGSDLQSLIDRQQLSTEPSVEIMEHIARAAHAMHLRGIVHRDLKPANVLISTDGQPKLADFGVAKRREADCNVTNAGAIVGTPCYMSPEQAEGRSREVGPRSDIFSLGVILYEMLTGEKPFVGDSVMSTLDLIRHADPIAPSKLSPKLPRDLETICLKCLEKDPARRYESAAELADDLQRYQQGEPVSARPLGLCGRWFKWAKRHPALAACMGLLALSFAGGCVGAAWHHRVVLAERDATHRYFQLSQDAIEVLLAEVAEESTASTEYAAETRRDILHTAGDFYKALLAEYIRLGHSDVEIAKARTRLAEIERWLGNHSSALELYGQASTSLAEFEHDDLKQTRLARHWLAESLYGAGEAQRTMGNYAEAAGLFQRAIDIHLSLVDQCPRQFEFKADLANCRYSLALCYREEGEPEQARNELTAAIDLLNRAVAEEKTNHKHMLLLARSHVALGHVLKELREFDKVDAAYSRASDLYSQMKQNDPNEQVLQQEHAEVEQNMSKMRATPDGDEPEST